MCMLLSRTIELLYIPCVRDNSQWRETQSVTV